MADTNPNANETKKRRGDELDGLLDVGLVAYSAVEPRAGLEERILANLRAEQARTIARAWWHWGFAGAVTVAIMIAVLAWETSRTSHPVMSNHTPAMIQQASAQETKTLPQAATEMTAARKAPKRQPVARRAAAAVVLAASPKLDQFPTRQPLSTEEIALAQYVRNFPKDAQLIAQAQQEFALETEKEMRDAGSENRPSGSTQQDSIQQER